jgi:hypothetical protein
MPERNMKIKSDYEKFRLKFKDPESKFNEKELLLIEKNYLFKDYELVYDCLFNIHLSLRSFNVTFEEERFETYEDFGVNHWLKSKDFAIDLLSCGKANISQIIEFISKWIGISKKNLMADLRFNTLLENSIRLVKKIYFYSAHEFLQDEIRDLIIKRIETITHSYLEMVDIFNFIDYLNIGFMGRINEYDFYPIKVWKKYNKLNSADSVKQILEKIFLKMGSLDMIDFGEIKKDSLFQNILPENEKLVSEQIGTDLKKRINIGAKMILEIKKKYPILDSFRYS